MSRPDSDRTVAGGGRPSIGNVLGFSMLLSEGEVLLRLGSRSLGPGLRLVDYEAAVAGVELPLTGELSAQRFRPHRCRVRQMTLQIEQRSLGAWLERRLVNQTVAGLSIQSASLDLSARLDASGHSGPCLIVRGRVRGSATWVALPIAMRAAGDQLVVAPGTGWVLGRHDLDLTALAAAIAQRLLSAHARVEGPVTTLDAAGILLPRPFVAAGWKVPDRSTLLISSIDLDDNALRLRYDGDDGGRPPAIAARRPSRVDTALALVRRAQAQRDDTALVEGLETLAAALVHHDEARVAVLRWLAESTRDSDPQRCLTALRVWLHLTPHDRTAMRMLIALTGRQGSARELAQRLTAACRFPNPPRMQARLELALAHVLVESLGDPFAARALIVPLAERLARGDVDAELATGIWTCLATAHAEELPRAQQALRWALATTERAAERASVQFAIGRALAAAGHDRVAEELLTSAAELAPDDPGIAEVLRTLQTRGHEGPTLPRDGFADGTAGSSTPDVAASAATSPGGDAPPTTSLSVTRVDPSDSSIADLGANTRPEPDASTSSESADHDGETEPHHTTAPADAFDARSLDATAPPNLSVLLPAADGPSPHDAATLTDDNHQDAPTAASARQPSAPLTLAPPVSASQQRDDTDANGLDTDPAAFGVSADDAPVHDAPVDDATADDATADDAPADDAPADDAPRGDAPLGDAPLGDAPLGDAAVDDARVGDATVDDARVGDAPLGDAPLGDAAVDDARVGDAPGDGAPADDAPADDAPPDDAPPDDAPPDDAPPDDAPPHEASLDDASMDDSQPREDARPEQPSAWPPRPDPDAPNLTDSTASSPSGRSPLPPPPALSVVPEPSRPRVPSSPSDDARRQAWEAFERDGDVERAVTLLQTALQQRPTDALLLSTLKSIGAGASPDHYFDALDQAIAVAAQPHERDRWALELAMAAADLDEYDRVDRALACLSPTANETLEAAALRQWLQEVEPPAPEPEPPAPEPPNSDDTRLDTLERLLDEDSDNLVEIRALADGLSPDEPAFRSLDDLTSSLADDDPRRTPLAAAMLQHAATLQDAVLSLAALRQAVAAPGPTQLLQVWTELRRTIIGRGDDATLSEFVAVCRSTEALHEFAEDALDACLMAFPESAQLHAALRHWCRDEAGDDDEVALDTAVLARLDALAARHSSDAIERARLIVGATGGMPGPTAAAVLAHRAESSDSRGPAFIVLVDALERAGHWPQVIGLYRHRAASAATAAERLDAHKRLAHVCTEILGDATAAIGHLEAALALAPTDPDLLLPLLDHHFGQRDLSRAVELTARVLDHVRMGHAAFASLAHRAADAAIAMGDPVTAAELLSRVVSRNPEDHKAAARLTELELMAGDPQRRIELLGAVADRQTGKARIEALEERARLLLASDRPDAAMDDLATVCREAPDRSDSGRRLAALYAEHGRHEALVTLHETQLQQLHGPDKIPCLVEIARLHTAHTGDLGRAEAALRIGLEHALSTDEDDPLRAQLEDALVDNLDRQGRFADLAAWLETRLGDVTLAPDDVDAAPTERRQRALVRLAAVYRDHLADEPGAATIYRRLEAHGVLPDDGLATLARWYRKERRHEDLVRILTLRSAALLNAGNEQRHAQVERWIAELLEGPLGRPQDAAGHYLDAYLADPDGGDGTGARARVLLSGTDSIANVRRILLERLETLPAARHAVLLALLADLLSPHEGYEREAEACYRRALAGDNALATAYEGLGRLLLRVDRPEEASRALIAAVRSDGLKPSRAADVAALAARALSEQGRTQQAERILRLALTRVPDSQRALMELVVVHEKAGRTEAQADVLERLAELPLSGPRHAEVAFQRAMLLRANVAADPRGSHGERARSLLLEAVSADARHAAARQTLIELATAREEWSIVAHMHYLTIRELPPGQQRAASHLDLAQIYLTHLGDAASCMRNIESALQQASDDIVVATRTTELARRMPDPREAAEHFEQLAGADNDLDDAARARLWLLAADLRMDADEAPPAADGRVAELATQLDDAEPRQAVQLLSQISELGTRESEPFTEQVRQRARNLAEEQQVHDDPDAAGRLRELLAARGDYAEAVDLSRVLATATQDADPQHAARLLTEAAGFAWHALRDPVRAADLLVEALCLSPHDETACTSLDELVRTHEASDQAPALRRVLAATDTTTRPAAIRLAVATLCRADGDDSGALSELRPLLHPQQPATLPAVTHLSALRLADRLFSSRGDRPARLDVLTRALTLGMQDDASRMGDTANELARLYRELGDPGASRTTCEHVLQSCPEHRGLLATLAELLEQSGEWVELARTHQRLAKVALADDDQAMWLTRAARVMLAHPEVGFEVGAEAGAARRLLVRACAVAPERPEPRATLLPLSFSQSRWRETLDLADELQQLSEPTGEREDYFVLAALAEAYRNGTRELAARLGHPTDHRIDQWLLPGLQYVLGEVASRGPLPRLDDVLGAAVRICGGRITLLDSMRRWALQRPVLPGISLGLGRLHEAHGEALLARHQYQLAAFLAPEGAVPGLVARLPLTSASSIRGADLTGGSTVREVLVVLREAIVGLPWSEAFAPTHPRGEHRALLEQIDAILAPIREALGLALPVFWVEAGPPLGVCAQARAPIPGIVVSPAIAQLSWAERAFRLATAATDVAMGLAVVTPPGPRLPTLLDALHQHLSPEQQTEGDDARTIVESLRIAGAPRDPLGPRRRAPLVDELGHHRRNPASLIAEIGRRRDVIATRLSGRLDGALLACARQQGNGSDRAGIVGGERAQWLLRALTLR